MSRSPRAVAIAGGAARFGAHDHPAVGAPRLGGVEPRPRGYLAQLA